MEPTKISTIYYSDHNQESQTSSHLRSPPPPYEASDVPTPILTQPTVQNISVNVSIGCPGYPPQNCLPGLEYLSMVDQLLVHQQIDLLQVVTGFVTETKFRIRNTLGQNVYFATENTDCCTRNCLGSVRPFDMKLLDNFNNEVMHLYRPLACKSCCFPCCLQTLEVSAPPGNVIGTVEQEWSIIYPRFRVKNAYGETVFKINGPLCTCSCGNDVNFYITSADGCEKVGKIAKQWSGLSREIFTDADNFGIRFPMGLDVKMKAVLMGALFLINFMYYETKADEKHNQ